MKQIISEEQYTSAMQRIDELLKVVNDDTPEHNEEFIELKALSDLVADYEDKYYPIRKRLPD
jgi:HTH-type transcriptional regulator/antitoxin HigA